MDGGFILGNPADLDGVDDDLIFQRIDSGQIIYSNPSAKFKLVGEYVLGNKLGEGSYAKVKECLHSETLQRCAVKIMKQRNLRRIPHGTENVRREIKLLRNLRHNNVIRLLDVHYNEEKGKIYMMMEYCVAVLQEMLDRTPDKKFPIWQSHGYFLQLVEGLEYLHSRGVVHKDIKPGNLLLTCEQTLKITDFGVAEQVEETAGNDLITCSQGSPMFQPPEVADSSYTHFPGYKLDVWSSGCTLFNLATGKYPFNGSNIFRIFESVRVDPLVVPPELDLDLASLLEGMLHKDPYKRMPLQEVKTNKWVQQSHPRLHGDEDDEDYVDDEVSLWGRQGAAHDSHVCSVIPFLQCHHFPEETRPYITEHEMHAGGSAMELGLFSSGATGGPLPKPTRRKRNKPTSCVTLRSLTNCSQS